MHPSDFSNTSSAVRDFLARSIRSLRKPEVASIQDDGEVIKKLKTAGVLGKKTLGEFYSATGLGKSQILAMSNERIRRFVAQAEENRKEDALPPAEFFEPKPRPRKFLVDLF